MATDVDVQYFSHLNGLTLGNNWGDLIRLLDKTLVTGLDFTQITAASIDTQGDVHITLYSAHNAMLLQVVELSGFAPASLNQRYRIKGVPNTTQLILKPALNIVERSITTFGTGKLASLGYDIIFRDANDVKRVYRARNPSVQHPFIRVDESLASQDGTTGVYTSTYAKSAMIGLLDHMNHIDDYQNPDVLQLPFDTADPAKNWKITGTGISVIKGWAKWHWAGGDNEVSAAANGNRDFVLVGCTDAFYFSPELGSAYSRAPLYGCGIINSALRTTVIKPWFLMSYGYRGTASGSTLNYYRYQLGLSTPLAFNDDAGAFFVPRFSEDSPIQGNATATAIMPSYNSGLSNYTASNDIAALEIPLKDGDSYLRGTLKHICFAAKDIRANPKPNPVLSDTSMYISANVILNSYNPYIGGFYFYLGEFE